MTEANKNAAFCADRTPSQDRVVALARDVPMVFPRMRTTPQSVAPGSSSIEKIFTLEHEILKMPQVVLPLRHYFSKGMYAREMFIPKCTVLTGAIHKTQHMSVISKGDISVLTEDGIKRLQAPCLIVSEPGMKRAGYAHEDTVWTTFHVTDETDIEKLEQELVHNDYALLMEERGRIEDLKWLSA